MRETGPAFKVFANEQLGLEGQDDTKPYIGPARTLLGILKNQMRLGGLSQGRMVRDFPDGTRVIVDSRFGIDKFTIVAPEPVVVAAPEETPPVPSPPVDPLFAYTPDNRLDDITFPKIVGYCSGDDGTVAVLWRRPGEVEVILGAESMALDISYDGTTIVGIGGGTLESLTQSYAWYWTRDTGVVEIPYAVDSRMQAVAYGVSETGRFICGYDTRDSDGSFFNWVYDRAAGVHTILPGPGVHSVIRISPNGLWVCAGDQVWNRDSLSGAWSLRVLPSPGTFSEKSTGPEVASIQEPDRYLLTDIADDGTACGYSTHVDVQTYTIIGVQTFSTGGTFTSHSISYTATYPLSQPVIHWTPDGGVVPSGLRGSTTQLAGNTRDKTIAGNNATRFYYSEIVLTDVTGELPGSPPTIVHTVDTGYGYPGDITDYGWVGGASLGSGTATTGISDDAAIDIGYVRAGSGSAEQPVFWRRTLDRTGLPLPTGCDRGQPTAVTTKADKVQPYAPGPAFAAPVDVPFDDLPPDSVN